MTCDRCNDTGYVAANPSGAWCTCDARPIDTSKPLAPRVLTPSQQAVLRQIGDAGRLLGDLADITGPAYDELYPEAS